jgi:hypothetical protein
MSFFAVIVLWRNERILYNRRIFKFAVILKVESIERVYTFKPQDAYLIYSFVVYSKPLSDCIALAY